MITTRVSLPGYDVLTDTNPDHFALLADQDNILIKEFARGSANIPLNNGTPPYTIAHNLGYIPLFFVYVLDNDATFNNNKWKLIAHNTAGASVPDFMALADANNIYIYVFSAAATTSFKWFIFYDVLVSGSTPSFTNTGQVFAVSKQGIDTLSSNNPNDYLFHSNLNTFKILKESNVTINYTTDGIYTFSHGASITAPSSYMLYMKFPDGKTGVLPGKGVLFSFNSAFNVSETYIDATQIGMRIVGTNVATSLFVKYYVFETPLV